MINLLGAPGVEIAQRVIAQGRQMNDRVEALQVLGLYVANV
jgi:hypothetical protein